jgi:hypothetical protein
MTKIKMFPLDRCCVSSCLKLKFRGILVRGLSLSLILRQSVRSFNLEFGVKGMKFEFKEFLSTYSGKRAEHVLEWVLLGI